MPHPEYRLLLATEDHREDVIRMSREFHQESPYKDFEYDEDKVNETISGFLDDDGSNKILVLAEVSGRIVGMIAALSYELYFNTDKVSCELMWWVDHEARKKYPTLGPKLLEAYEFWAKKVGCKTAQVVSIEDKILERFYRKRGYTKAEKTFWKEL